MPNNSESLSQLTTRLAGINNQRALAKELKTLTDAKAAKPMIAAVEQRITARAQELKASQRQGAKTRPLATDGATGKRAGKPAPQNSRPIAPGTFDKKDARPLAETFMTNGAEGDFKVAFGDDKSLIRNVEPVALTGNLLPSEGNLVTSGAVELDTSGLPARIAVTYVYLLDGDKPIGRCELAAPLPLAPGEVARFPAGNLVFRA